MKTLCAWCESTITPEDGTGGLDSHGICQDCGEKEVEAMRLGCGMDPLAALRFEKEWLKKEGGPGAGYHPGSKSDPRD